MEGDVRLKELVSALRSGEGVDIALEHSVQYVRQQPKSGGEKAHSYLCTAALQGLGARGRELKCRELLHSLGPAQALLAAYRNTNGALRPAVQWMAQEVEAVLADGSPSLSSLFHTECLVPSAQLSPQQEQLAAALCHLPDRLANKLGRGLLPSLLPHAYFSAIGRGVLECLKRVHEDIRDGRERSLAFPAAVVSKAALLGHAETVLFQVVPTLEQWSSRDPLWKRVSRSLFCRVGSSGLEPILTAVVQLTTPSLSDPHPLHLLLGDFVLASHRARLVLTHKLWLAKVPSNPSAVYNLIGYLSSWKEGQELLGTCLETALGVWSDSSSLRRMDGRQHVWICRLLVLGATALAPCLPEPLKSRLGRAVMSGLQAHLDCPVRATRLRGMAVGQSLMNTLHPSAKHQLEFQLEDSADVEGILQLARPVEEQRRELLSHPATLQPKAEDIPQQKEMAQPERKRGKEGQEEQEEGGRFGKGMVSTTQASISDSDDDLEPYAMTDDPDPAHRPPRYLRSCLEALISPSNPHSLEAALSAAESLIRSQPPDLQEVCVELARVLLHLQDSYDLPSFARLRHAALVSLTVLQPLLLAPYLTTEFYGPSHSTRQRLDILEVLSAAASELSTPSPITPHPPPITPPPSTPPPPQPQAKTWQQVVDERVKAKTRLISKGPRCPPPSPSPNRFSPVAPLFFFPLMASYDAALPTLDLLGRDSLLLGNLLHTLSTVLFAATHCPAEPAMAAALLEFVWALRYHPSSYVRQAVLCALSTVAVATPTSHLLTEMEGALSEAVQWAQDVCSSDADDEARALAKHTLSLVGAAVREAGGGGTE